MPLVEKMPDWLTEYLPELGTREDDLIAAAPTDLDMAGRFGEEWFLASAKTAWTVVPNAGKPKTLWSRELSGIEKFVASSRVGNGFLQIKTDGRENNILRYSNACSRKFAQIAGALTDYLKDGKDPGSFEDKDRTVCPECGGPFLRDSQVCPRCMNKLKVFARLIGYAGRYRRVVYVIILLMVGGATLRMAAPIIIKKITDDVFTILSGPADDQRYSLLLSFVGLLLASHIIGTLLRIAHGRLAAVIGAGMVFDFRAGAYSNLQRLSLSYYDKRQVGALMSRVTHDTEMIHHFMVDGIQFIFINLLTLILVAGIMFWTSPKLALLALVATPIVVYLTRFFVKKMMVLFHKHLDSRSRFHAVVNDSLSGIRVVKAFAQEDWELGRFQDKNLALRDAGMTVAKTSATIFPSLHFLSSLGTILVWLVGGYSVISTEITIGTFFMFIYLIGMLQGPLEGLSRIHHWISRSLAGAERIFEIVDAETEVKDPENPVDLPEITGAVSFDHVTFGYDRYKPVLEDINLNVRSGEMIGLVGHSGAGKTTIINLICRFYDPDRGSVTVDGADLRSMRRADYGRNLGVVLQESFLFSTSVADNIAYGSPKADFEAVKEVAHQARADEFILELPEKYDTIIGERGVTLSGGQRQRLTIARALLRDPRILILDDSTSSVDPKTEREIHEAMMMVAQNRTTFVIAHRLSTVRQADLIVVLDGGRIAETGTHDELLARNGLYKQIYDVQFSDDEQRLVRNGFIGPKVSPPDDLDERREGDRHR